VTTTVVAPRWPMQWLGTGQLVLHERATNADSRRCLIPGDRLSSPIPLGFQEMRLVRVQHQDAGPPWSGVPHRSVVELINRCCREEPARPAMVFEDGVVLTCGEFLERAENFAGYLAARTRPGERVAMMLGARVEMMIAMAAAMAVGCVPVAMDPAARAHDAGHVLRDSASVLAMLGEPASALIEQLRPDCPALRDVIVASASEPDGLSAYHSETGRFPFAESEAERHDIAAIYYTSGTTGLPKGCMLPHLWWLRLCDVHLRLTKPRPGESTLCCIPFHYTDSAYQLLCALQSGGTLAVMRRFSVSRFWETVHRHRIVELYLIASMPILLLKAKPRPIERRHGLRRVICAGVPASLHRELFHRFGVAFLDSYGSVEAGWNVRMPADHAAEMVGSAAMGVAVPECELRVADEADRAVGIGDAGQLLVRAPGLFAGYLNQPEATGKVMRGGWYHTGDLVRVDARGFYYFLGRSKDIIRRAGENIAAAEVEDVLRTHPGIRDAAVVAVADEIRGEEVKAYILLATEGTPAALPPEAIVAYCAERLASFKLPRYVEYWTGDFPRTATMRVRKHELAALAGQEAKVWDREARYFPAR
jgi:crotonobetaine/carnitine-CoA ligase